MVKKARDRVTSLVRQGVKLAKDKALAWVKQKIGGIKQRLLGFLQSRWNRLKDKLGIGESGKAGQQGAEGALQTDNAAKKAAELPAAIAQAKAITEANDAIDTPVPALLGLLGSLKKKYTWIKDFEAQPAGGFGTYSIFMIASRHLLKQRYTAPINDIEQFLDNTFTTETISVGRRPEFQVSRPNIQLTRGDNRVGLEHIFRRHHPDHFINNPQGKGDLFSSGTALLRE